MPGPIRPFRATALITTALMALSGTAAAQDAPGDVSTNTYGVPGLVDMPSALMMPDAELTTSLYLLSNGTSRAQVAFQLTPRIQGLFRYSTIPDFLPQDDGTFDRTYDRSFDLRVNLFRERGWIPAVTVGLQDFGGTSLYAGEYVVATKTFGDRLAVTGGIGWGRLGSEGSVSNPLGVLDDRLENRPALDAGEGGEFEIDQLFRGDAAFFAGVDYKVSDRWRVKAEYSSDAYEEEEEREILDRRTPLNFGAEYDLRPGVKVAGYVLHGAEIGLNLTFALNPKRPPAGSGIEGAPAPVQIRPSRAESPGVWTRDWTDRAPVREAVETGLIEGFEAAGLTLVATRIDADRAELRFRNSRYPTQAQAIGRAARAATAALPPSVETLVLVPEDETGIAGAAAVLRRSDIDALENVPDGAARLLAATQLVDAAALPRGAPDYVPDTYPAFDWSLAPYVAYSLFDPDNPLRVDLGLSLAAEWEPRPGLILSGEVQQRVIGNRDEADRFSPSELPRVRTDSFLFARNDGPAISHLTGEYFARPGSSLYGRFSVGLLERQYGGVSGELLWKPVDSRFALGAEVNRVRQREFDGGFGFQDLDATTAFVSGYYDHRNGFHSQLDVGQYLAGDRGATFTLSREFDNGWSVGAYATKTNVSAEEFGEGSFDKGLQVTIPLSWISGEPIRETAGVTIQPLLRDGGARLRVRNRLYDRARELTAPDLTDSWGRVWR